MSNFNCFYLAQNVLTSSFCASVHFDADSLVEVIDKSATKSLKLFAHLLDVSLWRCDNEKFLVGKETGFGRVSVFFSAQNLSATFVSDKTELMEFGL